MNFHHIQIFWDVPVKNIDGYLKNMSYEQVSSWYAIVVFTVDLNRYKSLPRLTSDIRRSYQIME